MSKSNVQLEADVLLDAKRRWEADSRLRRLHRCRSDDATSQEFQKGCERYTAAVLKTHRDNLPGARPAFQIPAGHDVISRILANPGLISRE